MKTHQFPLGRTVKVVKIADDLKCRHLGLTGEVMAQIGPGDERPELRYFVSFPDGSGHGFYESELQEVLT